MYNLSEKAIAEKYEDLLFTKVMALYAAEESEKILSEIENEEPADPKNIEKIYSKTERRENFSNLWKVSKKLITFAAMVVFVAVVSLSSVVVASAEAREAVAEAIYHLVLRKTDRYTEVSIGNSTGFIDPENYNFEGAYAPTYIPEGFVLLQKQRFGSQYCVDYKREGGYISFLQAGKDVIFQVDTEGADTVEKILIGESEGLLVSEDGNTYLNWSIGNTNFQIYGTCEVEEIIKMAQGIKPLGKTEEPTEEYEFIDAEVFNWEGAFAPTYMPEGFKLIEKIEIPNKKITTYGTESTSEYIIITQAGENASLYADTENADIVKNITINESDALYIEKNGSITIAFSYEDTFIFLSGELESSEIIKIAEGLKPIGKTETEEYEFVDPEIYTWDNAYGLTYVTENYDFYSVKDLEISRIVNYMQGEKYISFVQYTDTTVATDTEDADITKEIQIGESKGFLVVKDDWSCIFYSVEDILLQVSGTAPTEEIIKIAEGIKPLGKTENEEPAEEYEFVDPEIYTWDRGYGLTYITEGYNIYDAKDVLASIVINYKKDENYIAFVQSFEGGGNLHLDTEDADITKEIQIGESNGFLVVKDGWSCVTWSIGDVLLRVSGTAPTEEIIKVAKGIKPIN